MELVKALMNTEECSAEESKDYISNLKLDI
jgi:hypothetical protein